MLALLAVVAVFLGYELAERLWLADLDADRLHLLHRLRGVTASVLAAAIVGWLLLRAAPPLAEQWTRTETFSHVDHPSRDQRRRAYAGWFILLRWMALLVAVAFVLPLARALDLLPAEVWWPLLVTFAALTGLNVVYLVLLRRPRVPSTLLPMQAYGDLVVLAILLHLTGGVETPLAPLMLIHVIIAGIVLSPRHCLAVAGVGSLLFAGLAAGEAGGVLRHHALAIFPHDDAALHAAEQPLYVTTHVLLHAVILFLTAGFVSTLGRRIRRDEKQLVAFADDAVAHRQLVEQALETTETGLCVCNRDGSIVWTNERWRAWFGTANADEVARRCRCAVGSPAEQALADGHRHVTEVTWPTEPHRVYQITTAPLGGQGQPSHVVSLARDITEQQAIQARMLRAGKLAAVGELAGQVAHEVNNPIAIISAKARLLLEDDREPMPDKFRQELVKISDLADRVAQIAQGLLSYCRPSPATRQLLDVATPIRQALRTVDHRARNLHVTIDDQLPDHLPPLRANAGELQQLFLNLLLNALDAMPDGGELTISAESAQLDGNARLTVCVADTGHGIDEAIQEQVFEPFYTTKSDGKGTGLGLSICAGLVRSHSGRIYLHSAPGQGTRIYVELPVDEEQIHE